MPKSIRPSTSAQRTRLAVWLGGLAAVSLMPLSIKRAIGTTGVLHHAGHLAAFVVTGILFLQWKRPERSWPWLIWPLAAFAFALEYTEAAVYHNAIEWRDIVTDILGLLTALLVYLNLPFLGHRNQ